MAQGNLVPKADKVVEIQTFKAYTFEFSGAHELINPQEIISNCNFPLKYIEHADTCIQP